jgi:hypothetical protein
MAKSIPGQSSMFDLPTCVNLHSATSSQASADGVLASVLRDGRMLDESGRVVAPVSPSRSQAPKLGAMIRATFGRRGFASSESAALTSSLVSRLKARLPTAGSTLFAMTWKEKATPSGRLVSLLRASAHRTSDNGSGSWPTPNAGPQNDTDSRWMERRAELKAQHRNGNGFGLTLGMAASMATWPTPRAEDSESTGAHRGQPDTLTSASRLASWATPKALTGGANSKRAERGAGGPDLQEQARLASWHTPVVRDHRNSGGDGSNPRDLPRQVSGVIATGSHAQTEKPVQLNPAHSRWLMGYQPAWDDCAVTAMPSSRKSPRPSSGRIKKPVSDGEATNGADSNG